MTYNWRMTEKVILKPGEAAPDFSLVDDSSMLRSLRDFRGEKLIIFCYPKAMTPGCTTEACDFRDSEASLIAAGYRVLGVSPDPVKNLVKFVEKEHLTYPLLSDESLEMLTAYGAYGEKSMYGKIVQGVIRSTFIIDEEGRIVEAMYNVKATGHVARVRALVGLDAS